MARQIVALALIFVAVVGVSAQAPAKSPTASPSPKIAPTGDNASPASSPLATAAAPVASAPKVSASAPTTTSSASSPASSPAAPTTSTPASSPVVDVSSPPTPAPISEALSPSQDDDSVAAPVGGPTASDFDGVDMGPSAAAPGPEAEMEESGASALGFSAVVGVAAVAGVFLF